MVAATWAALLAVAVLFSMIGLRWGHLWLRVRLGDEVRDVCPGREQNRPGHVDFEPLTKVRGWGPGIFLLTYPGVPIANMFAYLAHMSGWGRRDRALSRSRRSGRCPRRR